MAEKVYVESDFKWVSLFFIALLLYHGFKCYNEHRLEIEKIRHGQTEPTKQ